MNQIQLHYPNWTIFFYDLLIGMGVFTILIIVITTILYFSKKEHASYKIVNKIKKIDNKIIVNFLNACYFLSRWFISFTLAYATWHTIVRGLTVIAPQAFSLPSYASQPVIFFIGLVGIATVIGSVHVWKKHIAHLFCIHCKI